MPRVYQRLCDFCKKPYKGFGRHYCSLSCRARGDKRVAKAGEKGRKIRWEKAERGRHVKCGFCGKERWRYPYQIKKGGNLFCSKECANVFNAKRLSEKRKGEGNPMYGKIPWNYINGKRIHKYATRKWRKYSKKIRKINGNKCKACGYEKQEGEQNLIVHHINGNPKNDKIENLAVLCRKCHGQLHAEMAKGGDVL